MTLLIGLVALMLWSGQPSASGRWLRGWMVERPAAALSRLRAVHWVFLLAALAALLLAFLLFESEGVRVVGAAVVEAAPWVLALDLGAVVELYALLWMLGATRQARALARVIGAAARQLVVLIQQLWRAGRARAARRSRQRRAPGRGMDADDGGGLAWA